jgi:hypothetical protein
MIDPRLGLGVRPGKTQNKRPADDSRDRRDDSRCLDPDRDQRPVLEGVDVADGDRVDDAHQPFEGGGGTALPTTVKSFVAGRAAPFDETSTIFRFTKSKWITSAIPSRVMPIRVMRRPP